ncbi:hypothetical protein FJ444_20150 [Aestuariibacter sp. GS-14]|uniref:O-antigen ligase family protein n=1 Tax=Aestuariibacter sp. GS-14 TaxID=2590670 RepID=UPI0011274930|nr:O-antigen ligase family protein [Aestuariibacter sp. GS-14]TPV53844.1 hypothetical protein FJ444_20150 [Aestuariibacter sp. GS-14]
MLRLDRILFKYYPIAWIAGLSLFYFHIIVILQSIKTLNRKNIKIVPTEIVPIILYISIYLFSLAFNSYGSPLDRIIASAYNLSFWVLGVLTVLVLYHNREEIDYNSLKRGAELLLIIIFISALLCLTGSYNEIKFDSLLAKAINVNSMPQLIVDSTVLKVFTSDWFDGGSSVRNAILSPYATATAAVSIMLFTIITLKSNVKSLEFTIWALITLICVISTFSRLLVALYLLHLLVLYSSELKRSLKIYLIMIFATLCILTFPMLLKAWSEINNLRSGSSAIRFLAYEATYEKAMAENPIFGLGVKDRGVFFIPLGSHSTFLGAFLKTGIFGLLFLITYSVLIIFRFSLEFLRTEVNRCKVRLISILMVMTTFWIFEDIDAAQLLSVCYFFMLGLYTTKREIQ